MKVVLETVKKLMTFLVELGREREGGTESTRKERERKNKKESE